MDAGFSGHVGYDVQLERENGIMRCGCLGMGRGTIHTLSSLMLVGSLEWM